MLLSVVWLTWVLRKFCAFKSWVMRGLMVTLERRHGLITVLKPHFLPKRLRSTKIYFIKAIDHTFYGFTGVITHLGCWENTRKACKSRAEGEWFTSFSHVLPTSRVGYHTGKPTESVVYCLNISLANLHPRPEWYIFHNLTREFIDDVMPVFTL